MSTVLEAVLAVAKVMPVFPCNPAVKKEDDSKAPYIKGGFTNASKDPEQIKRWWKQWPRALIGVPMGARSGLFCVDLDRKPGGADGIATWERLVAENGGCPQTRTHSTPSTGRHQLFRHRDGIRNIPLDKLAPGIEIKGEGGYVIWPPSVMADGKKYRVECDTEVEAPQWLLDMMAAYHNKHGKRDDDLEEQIKRDAGKGTKTETRDSFPPEDPERARAMLRPIPSDNYDPWYKVAGILRRDIGGNKGCELFKEWSTKSKKFSDKECEEKYWEDAEKITRLGLGTLVQLADQYDPDREWEKRYEEEKAAKNAPNFRPWKITIIKTIDLAALEGVPIPDQDYAVPQRVPTGHVTLFSGEGGAGKSLLQLMASAAHVVSGEWLRVMPKPGPALFIDCEDPESVLHKRLADVLRHYHMRFADVAGKLHLVTWFGQDALLGWYNRRTGKIEPTPLYKLLFQMAGDIKPVTIGLASVANVFSGSEIDRPQVQQFIGLLAQIAQVGNSGFSLISHPSLTGINTGSGISGSTQWHNAVRARMYLRSDKEAEKTEDLSSKNNLRILECRKNNYGPISDEVKLRWENGLFLPVDSKTFTDEAGLAKAKEVFLAILRRFEQEHQNASLQIGRAYAPALFAKEPEAKAAKCSGEALASAMRALLDDNIIEQEPYGIPSRTHYRLRIRGKPQSEMFIKP